MIPNGLGAFVILVVAVVVVLTLVLILVLSKDKNISRTSFGVFIERKRFMDDPLDAPTEAWPERKSDP